MSDAVRAFCAVTRELDALAARRRDETREMKEAKAAAQRVLQETLGDGAGVFVATVDGAAFSVRRRVRRAAAAATSSGAVSSMRELWAEDRVAELEARVLESPEPLAGWCDALLSVLPEGPERETLEIKAFKRSAADEEHPAAVPPQAQDLVACLVSSRAELQRSGRDFAEQRRERAAEKKRVEAAVAQELAAEPAHVRRVDFEASGRAQEACFVRLAAPRPRKKRFGVKALRKKLDEALQSFEEVRASALPLRDRVAKLCDPAFGEAFCDRLEELLREEELLAAAGAAPRVVLDRVRRRRGPPSSA